MAEPTRPTLKTGQRPVQVSARVFKPGEVLFEEGSTGRELFIIQSGKVGVYKKGADGDTELATIGEGGIIGEMSLLDNLPRSATVKAIDETKTLPIGPATFQATVESVPVWLASIIKIVVSRLRDANKRVDTAILRDKERGIASLMVLLLKRHRHEFSSYTALDYEQVVVEVYYVCRLKKKEIVALLEQFQKRGIIVVEEDTSKRKHICIKDVEVLRLFEEYLVLKSQKKNFREVLVADDAIGLLNNIAYVAQKSGVDTEEGTQLSRSVLVADIAERESDRLEKNLLDLKRRGFINMMPSDDDVMIVFRKETLARIKKIKEWLPRFEEKPTEPAA
jgi:CRP-like cAMP-binding protein